MSSPNDNVTAISTEENGEAKAMEVVYIPEQEAKEEVDEFRDNSNVPYLSYFKIFLLFLDFGFHAWGGPVAQISLIKERLVIRDKWITIARFNRVYGVYQILPGPEATELCMFFGCLAGGRIGGFLAGLAFLIPGFSLILLFSYIYVIIGFKNEYFNASFRALQPVVAALVLRAVHKIAEHSFISSKSKKFNYWLFSMAILASIQSALNINFFLTLGVCGIAFMFLDRKNYWIGISIFLLEFLGIGLYIGFKGVPSASSLGVGVAKKDALDPGHVFGLGLLAGSLSFGGAYTTIPFLKAEAVTIGQWMTATTFLDAIAIGNILPAPLVTFSTFIGFQAGYIWGGNNIGYGFLGATLITLGIFTPCFIFTIMGHEMLERLVRNKFLAAFFDGITGSVIGIIAITAMDLLKSSLTTSTALANIEDANRRDIIAAQQGSIAAVLYVLTLAILYSFKVPILPLLLVIFGAIAGQFLFVT
ncbi:2743_t:CDS:2 [Acaulospora morrowiae]|uniref:2743_t:CDS:1 n=1 Tax=Acaulospora morrowiae TaxID=94023 RepID=A0A9N8YPX1_9GLOM|nr:2743_t:CDS:2 [Acaulospora morrowiae]